MQAILASKAVREIDIVAALKAKAWLAHIQAAPAHVRNGHSRSWLELSNPAWDDPEARSIFFLRPIEQELHAKTDAEHRLLQCPKRPAKALASISSMA